MSNGEKDGWYGYDLDGTLAEWEGHKGPTHIGRALTEGDAFKSAVRYIAEGKDVRIFTARVDGGQVAIAMGNPVGADYVDSAPIRAAIEAWCIKHFGKALPVTNVKDYGCICLYDDRAVQVEYNTGRIIGGPKAESKSEVSVEAGEVA